jgi:hypothetical protein
LIGVLKPPGKAFAKLAVASTLCPACGARIKHPSSYTVDHVQSETAHGRRTRLVANQTLVIHSCATHGAAIDP